MKVFITGSTGFVGRHVMAEVHASGHDILASTLEDEKMKIIPVTSIGFMVILRILNLWNRQ